MTDLPLRFDPLNIDKPHLITLSFSHYCELARWPMDISGIDYTEISYAIGCHGGPISQLRQNESQLSSSSYPGEETAQGTERRKTAVPLVCMPDGSTLNDSWKILNHYYPALSDDWCEKFDRVLGPAVRRVLYHELLSGHNPDLVDRLFDGATEDEMAIMGNNKVQLGHVIKSLMAITDESSQRDRATIEAFFAECDALFDTHSDQDALALMPTAWWIAISSLSGLALATPEYGGKAWTAPLLEEHSARHQSWVGKLRDTRTGQLIVGYYRDHR